MRSPQTLSKHGLYIFISEQVVLCLKVNRDKGIVRIFLLLSHGDAVGAGTVVHCPMGYISPLKQKREHELSHNWITIGFIQPSTLEGHG